MHGGALTIVVSGWLCAGGCARGLDESSGLGTPTVSADFGTNPRCEQVYEVDATQPLNRLDLLLVVDATPSLAASRAALAAALPALLQGLSTGDSDDDGVQDVPAFDNVHAAVVTSDLGTGEIVVPGCTAQGDAAVFRNAPVDGPVDCAASYPSFLAWTDDPTLTGEAAALGCLTAVGDSGCAYTQPLAAALGALRGNLVAAADKNFLRSPNRPSLLGVLVLTDRDDCSAESTDAHLIADATLDADDPRRDLAPEARCVHDAEGLLEVQRLARDLRSQGRAGPTRVVFGAIAGVPAGRVSRTALEALEWSNDSARAAFYAELLDDPLMQPTLDSSTHTLAESCRGPGGPATPPRRLVEAAQVFGARGLVQSLCQDDLREALALFAHALGDAARPACLEPILSRAADGLVEDCAVVWTLNSNVPSVPTECDATGLQPAGLTGAHRQRCRVPQVAFDSRADVGWYLDDTSEGLQVLCSESMRRRVGFRSEPPPDALVTLECGCEEGAPDAGAEP
jgi:hypothetical protein